MGVVSAFIPALPGTGGLKLPEFPQTATIGFAAEHSSKGLDVQIVVPGETLKGVGAYVKQISASKAAPPQAGRMQPNIERKSQ